MKILTQQELSKLSGGKTESNIKNSKYYQQNGRSGGVVIFTGNDLEE